MLQSHTREIRMANPFSAVPTAYRVFADGRWWYANCAWDASESALRYMSMVVSRRRAPTAVSRSWWTSAMSCRAMKGFCCSTPQVPAVRWWDDIAFT